MPDTAFGAAAPFLTPYLIDGPGLSVQNPATAAEIAVVKDYIAAEVEAVIASLEAARPDWAGQTAKARSAILKRWHGLILENADRLADIVTAESGKPTAEAKGEVAYAAAFIEWFAEEAKRVYGDVVPHHAPGKRIVVLKQPVGVCAAITPWNFPLAMITRKAGPALAAGCPMVVKPAEATPLSALALEALAHEAGVPRDVFRVVSTNDPAAIGKVLCDSPIVRKLSFTGSTAVGKRLMAACAPTVKKVSMELGGNAPFIVFDDADLDAAVEGAMASKYRNAGQTCVCANRILVADAVYDDFVARLVERVGRLKVGDGAAPGVEIGPLINQAGVEKVQRLVDQALSAGAVSEVVSGADDLGGNYVLPRVLTGVTSQMDIANAEIFGPIAPVMRFSSEDEAVRLANDTPYGLAAYFYARDMARIWRVMEALDYGMVGVNDGILSTEVAPFGGVKESGVGREGSRYGIDEYVEIKYALLGGLTA